MSRPSPTADQDRLRAEYAGRDRRLGGSHLYSYFSPGDLFIYQSRQRAVLSALRRYGCQPLDRRWVLEVGCGRGGVLMELLAYGAGPGRLFGCDLLFERLLGARQVLPNLPLTCADGQALPYPDASFDLILQFTVFSSILDERIRQRLAQEMLRVMTPSGLILWYDFWLNPLNPQTRGIRPQEIRELFPGCVCQFQRITLAPPLARRLAPFSWQLCALLEKIVLVNSHYLAVIRRPVET